MQTIENYLGNCVRKICKMINRSHSQSCPAIRGETCRENRSSIKNLLGTSELISVSGISGLRNLGLQKLSENPEFSRPFIDTKPDRE